MRKPQSEPSVPLELVLALTALPTLASWLWWCMRRMTPERGPGVCCRNSKGPNEARSRSPLDTVVPKGICTSYPRSARIQSSGRYRLKQLLDSCAFSEITGPPSPLAPLIPMKISLVAVAQSVLECSCSGDVTAPETSVTIPPLG